MRRALGAAVVAVVLAVTAPSDAQDPTSTTEPSQVPTEDIIPKPNTGDEPTDAGDRGGSLQVLVLAVIVGGVGLGGYLAYRQSVRARSPHPKPE